MVVGLQEMQRPEQKPPNVPADAVAQPLPGFQDAGPANRLLPQLLEATNTAPPNSADARPSDASSPVTAITVPTVGHVGPGDIPTFLPQGGPVDAAPGQVAPPSAVVPLLNDEPEPRLGDLFSYHHFVSPLSSSWSPPTVGRGP
ncbi:hypothetical protein PC128_g10400 [Phytophthora cactorum]|nr:hypothetical protein PC128_g10400 [Phytophthora cactorum]KAG4064842.1 hypothetical protein PC123_g400 [Phytophthora cactorum]